MTNVTNATNVFPIAEFINTRYEHWIVRGNEINNNGLSRIEKKENDNAKITLTDELCVRWGFSGETKNSLLRDSERVDDDARRFEQSQGRWFYHRPGSNRRVFIIYSNISGFSLFDINRLTSVWIRLYPEERRLSLNIAYHVEREEESQFSLVTNLRLQTLEQYETYVGIFGDLCI
jgi:hypothetical protein